MPDVVATTLNMLGPCLSTELVAALVRDYGLTPATARQRVSRSTAIKKLAHVVFPRGVRFVYLQSEYASPHFWTALIKRLLEHSVSYGGGLAALMARGGLMPVPHFLIACGAPVAQKGHIAARGVLDRLRAAELVKVFDTPGVGECVELAQTVDAPSWELSRMRARISTEAVLLNAIKDWARNLGVVSYNKVALRDEGEEQPRVGTFNWDLAGPSYLAPLTQWDKVASSVKQGYLVCDTLLGVNVEAYQLQPFIHKCVTLRSLAKVGRCLQMFVADGFSAEAFALAKENGVIPATTTHLFGQDVAKALRELTDVLNSAFVNENTLEMVTAVFNKLRHIEGAATNLRGALFEYLVADVVRLGAAHTSIRLNEIVKDDKGRTAEIDVLAHHFDQSVRFIECKGYKPGGTVPDEMVERWLRDRIPVIRSAAEADRDWRKCRHEFEFWTSGVLSEYARGLVTDEAARVRKYGLKLVEGAEVAQMVSATNNLALKNAFRQHFQHHPLSTAAKQVKRVRRPLPIPPNAYLERRRLADYALDTEFDDDEEANGKAR
ncbi:hypothetical protein [Jeongeupia naejangsanensis]|uniref:Restriction endonuclease type IV Mrr domain-containing protein n=1 Tax=Jeongeupia naejangsanensis TaxID=613195 RepID=A0ABS2BSB7_9NEIS|nr:hypothetical protein [Jeongeupia naejangsanensis]MBM3117891.1 hypothetical protein [Jeongeupia naejangsanensis]